MLPSNPPPVVLVATADATAAALLGGLVETLGYPVVFATPGENPDASVRRVRPRIYIVDCATIESWSDESVGHAIMRGASVVLVAPSSPPVSVRQLAMGYDVEVVVTPPKPESLAEALDRAIRKVH